jgi:hypothetical protein
MPEHRGPVFMTDDDHARIHDLAVRRLLAQLARLLEEGGCAHCARTVRHVGETFRTIALEDVP